MQTKAESADLRGSSLAGRLGLKALSSYAELPLSYSGHGNSWTRTNLGTHEYQRTEVRTQMLKNIMSGSP